MTIFLVGAIFFGLIAGSFFNVLIYRLPRMESILFPASHCPTCNRAIRPWENIPLVSYALLGARCAGCRAPDLPPLPDYRTAHRRGKPPALAHRRLVTLPAGRPRRTPFLQCFALLLMIPITVIDLRHYIVPDALTYTLLAAGIAASFLPGDITPLQSLLGGLAGGGTLL